MLAVRSASSSAIRCRATQSCLHAFEDLPIAESSRAPRRYFVSTSASSEPAVAPRRKKETKGQSHDPSTTSFSRSRDDLGPRKRSKKEQAMKKAYGFSAALRKASFVGTRQNPLEPLSSLPTDASSAGPEMSVEELIDEILANPISESRILEQPERYRRRYKKVFARINQSFLLRQLREIMRYGVSGTTKPILIQMIMERKHWPVPPPVHQEVESQAPILAETKVLEMSESELFLFLRDTKFISEQYFERGIVLSTVQDGSNSISLSATGTPESLAKLDLALSKRSLHIKTRSISSSEMHGMEPAQGLLAFVSRMTGAYVERVEGDQYRISTLNPAKIDEAIRLLQIAGLRSSVLTPNRSRSILSPPPSLASAYTDLFAVLPFFSTPSMSLPWEHLRAENGELLYRLKKVKSWSSRSSRQEVIHRDEKLEHGATTTFGRNTEGDLEADIRDLFEKSGSAGKTTLTTTFGHLLLRHEASSPESLLSTPVPGQWPMIHSAGQLDKVARPIFTPALTPAMIHHTLDNVMQRSRRLRYRSHDGKTELTFTYAYPAPKNTPVARPRTPANEETDNWLIKLENMVAEMELEEKEREKKALGGVDADAAAQTGEADITEAAALEKAVEDESPVAAVAEEPTSGVEIQAERSGLTEVDLMMPDRPVDCQMTLRSSTTLGSESIPQEVIDVFQAVVEPASAPKDGNKAKKLPPPPFEITISDETFTLDRDDILQITEAQSNDQVITLRSVQCSDLLIRGVSGHINAYTELEYTGATLSTQYWREMANITRDVQPGATSLIPDAGLLL